MNVIAQDSGYLPALIAITGILLPVCFAIGLYLLLRRNGAPTFRYDQKLLETFRAEHAMGQNNIR